MKRTAKRPGRRKDPELAARRREQILSAATAVFARDGYADADLQAVADAVGVAKGTLYLYFPSKERLFLAAVDRGMHRLRDRVRAAYAPIADPLDRLQTAIHSYLEFFKDHPELTELMILERAVFRDRKKATYFEHLHTNVQPWREVYAALIREGRVRDVPVDRILDVINDLLYGTMFTNHFSGRHKPLAAQAADITDVCFHGILTPRERARRGGA